MNIIACILLVIGLALMTAVFYLFIVKIIEITDKIGKKLKWW